jgi:N-hydroxyarylamine O-acetyltransferase
VSTTPAPAAPATTPDVRLPERVDAPSWGGADLDLDAYLARIGHTGPLDPTPATLRALHRAHMAAIPFENLDAPLGRGVEVGLDRVQDKLVVRRRGGYCFEQNLLFAAVLERLGFTFDGLLGRVQVGASRPRPATHMVLRVRFDGGDLLADVGFGGGLLEPIALADGAEERQGDWEFRVEADPGGGGEWWLRSRRAGGWLGLYVFTLEPRHEIDYVVANHYVATHPRSPFSDHVFLQRLRPDGLTVLDEGELVDSRPDGTEERRPLDPEAAPAALRDLFGIDLDPAGAAALTARLRRGREA